MSHFSRQFWTGFFSMHSFLAAETVNWFMDVYELSPYDACNKYVGVRNSRDFPGILHVIFVKFKFRKSQRVYLLASAEIYIRYNLFCWV